MLDEIKYNRKISMQQKCESQQHYPGYTRCKLIGSKVLTKECIVVEDSTKDSHIRSDLTRSRAVPS